MAEAAGSVDSSELAIKSSADKVRALSKPVVLDEVRIALVLTSCLATKSAVCRAEVKLAVVEGRVDVGVGEETILEAETGMAIGQKLHN